VHSGVRVENHWFSGQPGVSQCRRKNVSLERPRENRIWNRTFLAGIALCAMGLAGFVVMKPLQDAADRATQIACQAAPSTAHYSKGFPYALPVGVLAALLLGIVLILVVLFFSGRKRLWVKALGTCTVLLAVLPALFVSLTVAEYHDYPGSDISTVSGHPCGHG
jgi:hypothetical protein